VSRPSTGLTSWRLGALLAIALSGLAVGCGGGGGSGESTTARTAAEAGGSPSIVSGEARGDGGSGGAPAQQGRSKARERAAYERARYGDPSSSSAPFSKYSGKGKVKLHLAEFGIEASSSDRAGAEAAIAGYLAALVAEDWGKACSYLASAVKPQIQQMAAGGGGQGCGEALRTYVQMSRKLSGEGQILARGGIASLRIESSDGAGFALFHGSDGRDHWIAVAREDGWKVISALPQPFD
jgi:hypothetical protein